MERDVHEADASDAKPGNLERLCVRQRPRLKGAARCEQAVERDGKGKVEEGERHGEVEASREDRLRGRRCATASRLAAEDGGWRRRWSGKGQAGAVSSGALLTSTSETEQPTLASAAPSVSDHIGTLPTPVGSVTPKRAAERI